MPFKRRNGGRAKKNRGHTTPFHCNNCGRLCPKDKIVKRFFVRDMVDASSYKDIKEALAVETFVIPKMYEKKQHCISCAIHGRIVRVRSRQERKNRTRAVRVKRDQDGKVIKPTEGKKEKVESN